VEDENEFDDWSQVIVGRLPTEIITLLLLLLLLRVLLLLKSKGAPDWVKI